MCIQTHIHTHTHTHTQIYTHTHRYKRERETEGVRDRQRERDLWGFIAKDAEVKRRVFETCEHVTKKLSPINAPSKANVAS